MRKRKVSAVNLTLLYTNAEAVIPAPYQGRGKLQAGIQPRNTGFRGKPGMTNGEKRFLNHDTKRGGFTLVEVMITLTILGFILLMISGTFRLGISSWEKGESTRDEYQRVRIVSQLISEQIKSAVPYKIKTQQAEGNYLAFEGKAQKVKFVSTLPIRRRHSGGWVYSIYEFKEGGKEGGQLVLYEQRVLNKNFFEEDPEEESAVPLLGGVSSVRFEYYREEDSEKNQPGGWVEEWNAKEEKGLPRMVRMTILQKNGEKGEKELPITVAVSLPAYQFEEVRTGVTRGSVPTRAPGTRTLMR